MRKETDTHDLIDRQRQSWKKSGQGNGAVAVENLQRHWNNLSVTGSLRRDKLQMLVFYVVTAAKGHGPIEVPFHVVSAAVKG
jgi:hypothetical protein